MPFSDNLKTIFFKHVGLGHTVSEIDISAAKVFSKTVFSMVIPEVEAELFTHHPNRKSVVLFGIEVSKLYSYIILLLSLTYESEVTGSHLSLPKMFSLSGLHVLDVKNKCSAYQ